MTALTISAKGQLTLRQEFLQYLGVVPGQKLDVFKLPGGGLGLQASPPPGHIDAFVACLKPATPIRLSLDELSAIAAQGWATQA